MDAQKYLDQIKENKKYIHNKRVELYQLWCIATGTTAPMGTEPVQTSGVSDKVGNMSEKILEKEIELKELIEKCVEDNAQRIAVIEQVKNESFLKYQILFGKYVEFVSLKKIARKEKYSYQYIKEMHIEALQDVQKILDRKKGQGQ